MEYITKMAGKSLLHMLLLSLLIMLGGCEAKAEPELGMELVGYNHTVFGISDFDVTVIPGKRTAGGYIAAGQGGGGYICCISVPKNWRAGLMANVNVRTVNGAGQPVERSWSVPVPQYASEQAGHFSVHFLRDGQVKVFATNLALWHPDYPLKGPEAELKPGSN
ncbi:MULTISPECIES: DUF3304 domain-containing protein [Herbaspirillum]|uniref:DUF3304 domain-containing protein n=1 Tax=Herbaspirillum huttiense subsp. lycopersici TaxID=3074428 RepID=A0ABU2EPR0_9BURK|nr:MULTISPECIES: DUF3304 domain-containing protein [Herbaspirillum]MDR9850136.1 DUF3304 domain-containing protein [Herbaspirillum huttiense SE1]MEE1638305.1 DUF3304 domain-containing protein [Herbaspirillum huttiense NC40101]|tara:strand:- start:2717 stop:3208 length:492 start_codon:yes stop_codon:yes gene_type:complete